MQTIFFYKNQKNNKSLKYAFSSIFVLRISSHMVMSIQSSYRSMMLTVSRNILQLIVQALNVFHLQNDADKYTSYRKEK